uniref:ARAD1D20724p n=1 Tax=Blastobotrys adeninivorans TaxID=409370 RepID=A0A060TA54_BLAAD
MSVGVPRRQQQRQSAPAPFYQEDESKDHGTASGRSIPLHDPEAHDEMSSLTHQLSRVMSQPDTVHRIESLSRVLSHRTHRQGQIKFDPENMDLRVVLEAIVNRMEAEGQRLNRTGVTFKGLTVNGVDTAAENGPSVTEVALKIATLPHAIRKARHPKLRQIVRNFDGIIEAGEMLLVLGRPGSGCSTFLRTIAGEVDGFRGVEGDLRYDGVPQTDMLKHFKDDIIYNPELDVHFPHLTVDQTLRFAIASRTPRVRLDGVDRKEYETYMVELLATVFGLRHTFHTKVGNDFVRGVSGGERKRVSIAEALAARASVYCWDNATRGLDASTALEYNHAIRAGTNLLQSSAIVAIYQAGENIYELYDKVTVIYAGQQVYFGPADQAKAYFENMGWQCPPRQTTAEFLTAVTDPNGRTPRPGYEDKVPKTADEFVAYWHNSPEYAELCAKIDEYNSQTDANATIERFKEIDKDRKMKRQRPRSRYMLTYAAQLKLAIKRGYQRVLGDRAYTITNVMGSVILSLTMGSLFYHTSSYTSGAFSRGGVLFFALLYNALTSLAEISSSYEHRPILQKQKSYSFYHPSVEAIQHVLSDLPVKLATLAVFSIILYFLAYLNQTAGQFFFFLLVLYVTSSAVGAMFLSVASLTRTASSANAIAGVMVLLLIVYSGYMIPTVRMHPWFSWVRWLDPLQYGFESLMGNELHGREMPCDLLVPQGGGGYENITVENQVCAFAGSQPGQPSVEGDAYIQAAYGYKWDHAWRNFGILIAWWIFYFIVNAVGTELLPPMATGGDVLLFKRGHLPDLDSIQDGKVAGAEELRKVLVSGTEGEDISKREVFSWQHVDYTIPLDGGHRQLLNDIQGYVKPGTMTALMGESGAGKTTLLNVLSQRISFGVTTGDMLVNGKPLNASFQRRTGYVQQQDLHLAQSTVRESLQFAARLRQPASVPDKEKLDYVETILELLGMKSYAEAYVGSPGRGLNVEQRKKLSIAVELVAKPSLLLFLDEPTSGLDSQSAWAIVTFMRSLANAGQAILCTIHQPSATLFEEFDRLLLLKKGGRTVYFGDIGKNSSTLISYFERHGARKCEPSENPAEYILEAIGAGATAHVHEDWGDIWANSEEYRKVTEEVTELQRRLAALPPANQDANLQRTYAASYPTQLYYVFRRTLSYFWRSPDYIMAKTMLHIVGGLLVGFTFWKVNKSLGGMQDAMFAGFLILVVSAPAINQIQSHLVESRELYEVREAASNTFHWSCMLLSQLFVEMIYHIPISTILFLCFYWPVGYSGAAKVAGYFYFIYCVLFQLYYVSFGLWVGYFSPDAPSANVISSVLFSYMVGFCGVMQPVSQMPGFWTFMYKVSPYTYIIQSLLGAVLHDREVKCEDSEFSILQPPSGMTCGEYMDPFMKVKGGYINNLDATSDCQFCPYSVGDQYLITVGAKYSYHWRNVGFICAYIAFNIFAMLGMYYLLRVKTFSTPKWIENLKKKAGQNKGPQEREPAGDIYQEQPGDAEMFSQRSQYTNHAQANEKVGEVEGTSGSQSKATSLSS